MMYIYILGLLVFQHICYAGGVEDLVQLRKAQMTADYAEYNIYENEASKHKEHFSQAPSFSHPWWQTGVAIIHAFPWIVWQILCLVLIYICMVLVVYRIRAMYIWCILLFVFATGSIVCYGYYERYRRIGFISEKQAPMYVYPGAKAIRSYFCYGDEVSVDSVCNDYVLVSSDDGKRGWIAWHMVQEV